MGSRRREPARDRSEVLRLGVRTSERLDERPRGRPGRRPSRPARGASGAAGVVSQPARPASEVPKATARARLHEASPDEAPRHRGEPDEEVVPGRASGQGRDPSAPRRRGGRRRRGRPPSGASPTSAWTRACAQRTTAASTTPRSSVAPGQEGATPRGNGNAGEVEDERGAGDPARGRVEGPARKRLASPRGPLQPRRPARRDTSAAFKRTRLRAPASPSRLRVPPLPSPSAPSRPSRP